MTSKPLLLLLALCTTASGIGEDYVGLTKRVAKLMRQARIYEFPVNNDEYYLTTSEDESCLDTEYDFIIVGTGSAGGVLANRLTETGTDTVLALEAGGETPELSNMLGVNIYLHRTRYNWGYNTTVQKNMCLASINQQCPFPRGKMLGGSSAINFGMYVRGNHKDFDRWAEMGNPGWSYEDVLPYFKKAEHFSSEHKFDAEYHGFYGPQSISIPEETPLLTEAIVNSHIDLGLPEVDYNGKTQNGVSRLQFFLDKNIRASTNHAYLNSVRGRSNLDVSINSLVSKVLIVNKRAVGVQYIRNGQECYALARKEVILSAGSINSPQVLMLSGVGPRKELEKHGIDVVRDLPVGQNMQEHQFFPGVFYRTNHTFYNIPLEKQVELWTQNKRPLTPSLGQQAVSFWQFNPQTGQPEIELFFFSPPKVTADLPLILGFRQEYIDAFRVLNPLSDFNVNVELLHPRSRGSVTLASKNSRDFPIINPNYFSDPEGVDLELMYQGVLNALKLSETETLKNFKAELIFIPVADCDGKYEKLSKDWWYCTIKAMSSTLYHPVSTTRMGPDPATSVVDHDLKVHGIDGLRVVDAGVFPEHISGHPNAAVVMIAEKISDAIKMEHS